MKPWTTEAPPSPSEVPSGEASGPPVILVIEDAEVMRRSVERSLGGRAMRVALAANGEEGLHLARELRPALILTDVNMPGMDGFEVLETVRADPILGTTPVVIVTAVDDRASIRRGMRLGADDYLTKPFTTAEIRETVEARLAHHQRIRDAFSTRLEKARAALWHAKHHDPESGLPNRTAFRAHLEAVELDPSPMAVIFIALDRFDRLHSAFHVTRPSVLDAVIRDASMRTRRVVGDEGVVFRIGTSRFAILYGGARDAEGAEGVADAVLHDIRQPMGGSELELRVTASAGVAMWDVGRETAVAAAAHAESAAFHAGQGGGSHTALYDPALHDRAFNRLVLESSMHRALEREQFELHYQPQVCARTGALRGVEALIRWNHPELGMVSPFHFIPVAEETGLIVEIGRWVLRSACAEVAGWGELPAMRVAVNLSALQLKEERLSFDVMRILDETGLPPRQLKLELTESMMIQAGDWAGASLRTLRDQGIGISIDDFGTGYSSLSNLRSFPIAELKIDRSFVRHVPDDREASSIVRAVIEMAHQLGLRVIDIQGYYYSKPLPASELRAWAREHRAAL
jgi:predicted signal transduction protein with EAL and GGDEF domain